MYKKMVGIIVCMLLLFTNISIIGAVNVHTSINPSITNLTNGFYWVGVEYTFFITHVDPEGDQIFFIIDWGDGTNSGWLGPYNSGETIYITHYWTETGNYYMKYKTKDIYGSESEWSELNIIVIPPNRFFKNVEINGTLKTKPWRGLIISILNFDIATVSSATLGNAHLGPFTCHNYRFFALVLQIHSYNTELLDIEASAPFMILLSY